MNKITKVEVEKALYKEKPTAQVGITLNDAEKTTFKLMYAVNKANFDNGNN